MGRDDKFNFCFDGGGKEGEGCMREREEECTY
jgi:hypothetical protein